MPIKRVQFKKEDRPTIERNGKTYRYDYDVVPTDDKCVIEHSGDSIRFTFTNVSKHGRLTTTLGNPDAITAPPVGNYEHPGAMAVYIHQPD